MTIAKAVISGTVFRAPEERFTTNNVGVTSLVLDIGEKDETLVRVISKRTALSEILSTIEKGDRIIVEGRLQTANAKMDDGSERKIYELDASTIETMGANAKSSSASSNEDIVKIQDEDLGEELISEEEIPF